MGLFDIFKKKEERKAPNKCAQCLRPITGYVYDLDNKNYCRECYNREMAIIQQTGGQGKVSHTQVNCQQTKHERNTAKTSPTLLNTNNTPRMNKSSDIDIIMGKKPSDPKTLLFSRKQWTGKGESGVDWIELKHQQGKCFVIFKSACTAHGESLPSLDNIEQKKYSIPLDEIKAWDYHRLLDLICAEFDITRSPDDCITEDEYNCWLEKIRLLNCVSDRIYMFNGGYADSACCILYNNQKYYFYLKEIGNNKGYCLGQKVYGMNEDDYIRFADEKLDRNSLSDYVCDLPHGDQDWLENENFIEFLMNHISNYCMNDLETLIRDSNYDTWVALCLHKTTHEVYVVRGENTFWGDMQCGGRMESHISSISIASLKEISSIVNKELNYNAFCTYQANYRNISQKKLTIAQEAYGIEYFIVIDNIEVPQNQILFGASVFQVPAQFLTEEQRQKYAGFYTRTGPYEHCYDLPVDYCQKVVRKLVSIES